MRKDGREVVFSSNRAGGLGGQDGLGESRPSLSRDALQLPFGRAGLAGTGEGETGLADVYLTTRDKASN